MVERSGLLERQSLGRMLDALEVDGPSTPR